MSAQPVRVAIDLETTGLQADQDSIIEVAAIKFAGPEVLETFASFVAPRVPLPYRIQRLTGILPADLVGAPSFAAVAPSLRTFLGEAPLVGHSVAFDAAFLRRVGLAHRNPLVDTYELASALLPNLTSYSLESVGAALGLASPTYHRALADAGLARDVFLALLERLHDLDPGTMRVLGRLAATADWSPAYFIRAALRPRKAVGAESGGDRGGGRGLAGLGTLGAQLTAKLGVDPAVLALAIARDPAGIPTGDPAAPPAHDPAASSTSVPAPRVADPAHDAIPDAIPVAIPDAISAADTVAGDEESGDASAPDTSAPGTLTPDAPAPDDVAPLVTACLAEGGIAAIETDVGVAGMMSCLLPALRWAATTGERVLVAAAGLAAAARLARQIVPQALVELGLRASDLPVAEVGELPAYLCLHRWFGAATQPRDGALGRDAARGLAKIAVWSGTTTTGLRGDVALSGPEQAAWERARAGDEFRDSSADCAYRRHGYCFAARAEAAAQSARVIVTTHAALARSLAGGERMLAEVERIIVLDAQLLEEELRRATSWSVERRGLAATLADLASTTPRGERAGLLHLIAQRDVQRDAQRDAQAPETAWFSQVRRAERAAGALFAALGRLYAEASSGSGKPDWGSSGDKRQRGDTAERAVYLDEHAWNLDAWPEVEHAGKEFDRRLDAVARLAAEVAGGAIPTGATLAADGVAADLQGARRALEDVRARVGVALTGPHAEAIHWLRASQPQPGHVPAPRPTGAARARRQAPGAQASSAQASGAQVSGAQAAHAHTPGGQYPTVSPSGDGNGEPPALFGATIDIGGLLAPLRAPGRALILAGPALAAAGDFEYLCGALGLPLADLRTHFQLSDRSGQTLLAVPEDVPTPNTASYQTSLDDALVALGSALGGRLVALFPSHAAVRAAYGGIRQRLEHAGVLVLAQGVDGSARQLWQAFRNESRVVLLGTGVFWDGAEPEGTPPACVVVTRLPFPSLSDPVQAARAHLWQDPHAQFVVPTAALKVRQALNGLAWSHTRRNAVVLLDGRVTGRAYGASILATLPQCASWRDSLEHLAARVAEWVAADALTADATRGDAVTVSTAGSTVGEL